MMKTEADLPERQLVQIPRRATLNDVAREAGVSAVAVSVVMNGSKTGTRVSEVSRQRITAAARRLRYTPNEAARSLARGTSKVLGVVLGHLLPLSSAVHDPGNEYTFLVIEGITAAAGERGYHLFMFTNRWRENTETVEILRDRRTDGLILLAPPADTHILSELSALNVRFVTVANPAEGLGVTTVDVDDVAGTRQVMEHLFGLGHRRIAHVMGPLASISPRTRLAAYRAILAENGLPYRPEYEVDGYPEVTDLTLHLRSELERLMSLPEPPTAVFVCDDTSAVRLLREAEQLGLAVPERLSVVGYDDRPVAALVSPSLTTIRQPMSQIGYTAANALMDELEAEQRGEPRPTPQCIRMETELVVRQSTAPPAH